MATRCQILFAKNRPFEAWLLFGSVLGAVLTGLACELSFSALEHWWFSALLAGSISVGSVAGFFCALVSTPFFLSPLYHLRAIRNGAPFEQGDDVRVLTGPYRDVIGRVYGVWKDRGQLRIDLSKEARRSFEDVFSFVQVSRETGVESAQTPPGGTR